MQKLKKSEKRLLIMIGILVIVFLIMDPYNFFGAPEPPKSAPEQASATTTPEAQPTPTTAKPTARATGMQRADSLSNALAILSGKTMWEHDPFFAEIIADAENPNTSQFHLSAVSIVKNDKRVILNGNILGVGDDLDGWRIVEIRPDGATISRQGNTQRLKVSTKPPAAPATAPATGARQ